MTAAVASKLSCLSLALWSGGPWSHADDQPMMSERILFAFDSPDSGARWFPVNDTVMGGVSSSACRISESSTLEFAGTVSLENNGGFASVRVQMGAVDLSGSEELRLRVRGDGKRYTLSVQTDYRIPAGAYYLNFETEAGQWQEIHAPWSSFRARSFGRPIPTAPPLNSGNVRGMGLMISDKQAGPFRIEVDWIKVLRPSADARPEGE